MRPSSVRRRLWGPLAAALALTVPAQAQPPPAPDPAQVIAAERALERRAAEAGVTRALLDTMAREAIVFAPGPVSALSLYGTRRPEPPASEGGAALDRRATFAGVARSGDFGFTAGRHLTVWARQPDGRWRWLYDGTPGPHLPAGSDGPIVLMAPGDPRPRAPDRAMDEVRREERRLARDAGRDVARAYRRALAADARLQDAISGPAATPEAVAAAIAARPPSIDFGPMGGGVSAAGDLAWTYGFARWETGGGYYVRIWRRGREWELVFEQLQTEPPRA